MKLFSASSKTLFSTLCMKTDNIAFSFQLVNLQICDIADFYRIHGDAWWAFSSSKDEVYNFVDSHFSNVDG